MRRAVALALSLGVSLAAARLAAGQSAAGKPAARQPSASPEVAARLTAPPGEVTVGDPVALRLIVTHPPGTVLDPPDLSKRAEELPPGESSGAESGPPTFLVEEIQPLRVQPPAPGETSWTIAVRPFAPGDLVVPAFTMTYKLPGDAEARTITAGPVTVKVKSVLKSNQDEAADIKGPWWLPREWWPWILGAAAALAAAVALWALWRRIRRRRRVAAPAVVAEPTRPHEPPYQRAIRELEALIAAGLLEQGRLKEFHVRLAEIVKRFLGGQHGFDALDRTTQEVMADLRLRKVEPALLEGARRFLDSCDLVKFAKHRPGEDEVVETIAAARALIETGRPAVTERAGVAA